jgi:hypothetical protein
MERNRIDDLISENLKEEVSSISMSSLLKEKILSEARNEKLGLYQRFLKLMNTTIEISVSSALAACLTICILTFSAFSITSNIKKDKSLMGYTSIKTVNTGGMDIIVEYENEVGRHE